MTVGISGAWIANLAALEPYRPYVLGVALVCMGLAYQRIYRAPSTEACEAGTVCAAPQTRRSYKVIFWMVSALVLAAFSFPYAARFLY